MRFVLLLSLVLSACSTLAPPPTEATSLPLASLAGEWDGTLVYTNYSDDASRVTLTLSATAAPYRTYGVRLALTFIEPDGSSGGQSAMTLLPTDSALLYDGNAWAVLDRSVDGDDFSVTIERMGEDNNRPATIRRVLSSRDGVFTERKTVRYEGTEAFFERNTVRLTRR